MYHKPYYFYKSCAFSSNHEGNKNTWRENELIILKIILKFFCIFIQIGFNFRVKTLQILRVWAHFTWKVLLLNSLYLKGRRLSNSDWWLIKGGPILTSGSFLNLSIVLWAATPRSTGFCAYLRQALSYSEQQSNYLTIYLLKILSLFIQFLMN